MNQVKIVIGANFGDEGKGVMTDYFCRRAENPLVIRFNSGAQAGHTVIAENGRQHVFGHFGSGSYAGAPIFLSRFFTVNPMVFFKERKELYTDGINPVVYVDERCRITTPYDMKINQLLEKSRGTGRHGSCGLGFYETVLRDSLPAYSLTVSDIKNGSFFRKMMKIQDEYVEKRLCELDLKPEKEDMDVFRSDALFDSFLRDAEEFLNSVSVIRLSELSERFGTYVMEGAQGLMLDQDYPYFPHVTPSKTGLAQALTVLEEEGCMNGLAEVEVVYVTRCYLTRHGAGPMPDERPKKPFSRISDPTNQPNSWQGTLRFGLIDSDLLSKNVQQDYKKIKCKMKLFSKVKKSIAVTCLDQAEGELRWLKDGGQIKGSEEELLQEIFSVTAKMGKLDRIYTGKSGRADGIMVISNASAVIQQ